MIVRKLINQRERALLAVLIDPGKTVEKHWIELIEQRVLPDFFFVGGSIADQAEIQHCVRFLKSNQDRPVILFPGSEHQVCKEADAILLLSLISGRNPDLLIGKHVQSAVMLDEWGIEIIPTAYILIDNGSGSSVQRISMTEPIARTDIYTTVSTGLAGQQLGMQLIYLEAGSGALLPVPASMIFEVKKRLQIPLIVGGGIDSTDKCKAAIQAGADIIVIGNILEKKPEMLGDFFKVLTQSIEEKNNSFSKMA